MAVVALGSGTSNGPTSADGGGGGGGRTPSTPSPSWRQATAPPSSSDSSATTTVVSKKKSPSPQMPTRRHADGWRADLGYYAAVAVVYLLFFATLPLSLFFCVKIVHEYKRMVVFRLGRLLGGRALGPGLVFVLPCIDEHETVDMRTVSFDVKPQEMLTSDSVTVSVDAAIYFRTNDPVASVSAIHNAALGTKQLAQTTLRNVLGTRTLMQLMTDRDDIAQQAHAILDAATNRWGIAVERVEVKDVRLPVQLRRVMAAEAEAVRAAAAKLAIANGELEASAALTDAADHLAGSPAAIQLRTLQTLVRVSAQHNHTVIVPFPTEAVRRLLGQQHQHKIS